MRRLASFVARRVDKPDAPSTSSNDTDLPPQDATTRKARMLNSLSRKLTRPSRPHLLASDSAHSSSASSASAELRTPDEEARSPSQRGNWKSSWLGAKNHRNEGDLKAAACLPSFPPSAIALRPPPRFNDTDDTSSELEDDPPPQISITQARDSMRAMILNNFIDRPSCPPLLDAPGGSQFPRSCLPSRHMPRRDTLESKMHKAALLHKLESLTSAEERSIAPLGARPVILVKEAQARNLDIDAWPKPQLIKESSGGLGNWVARPCFEDRVVVWTRQERSGQIVSSDVAGSQFGVAALEFSDSLQILAGWLPDAEDNFDPSSEPHPESSPPESTVVALPSKGKPTASVAVPGFEFSPLTLAVDSPERSESTKELTSPKQAEPPVPRVKRGVRFAEDDKDDQIPLGYVLRIRKKREEKAKFLREEREKRALEEDKRAREEERRSRLLEAEKREQERERTVRELQKRKTDEEKRHQNYTAELHASRSRSEASRAGHISPSSLARDIERDISASQDARQSKSPHPRQRTLDLMVPTANLSPYDGSPTSSMPATPQGSQRSFSRPPSVYSSYTTSSEDVRARDGRRISRHSVLAFDPSKQSPLPLQSHRASLLPYNLWANGQIPPVFIPQASPVPIVPMIPMMTPMPFYPMDIPLLPPTPPFMMNQFGHRPRSTNLSHGQIPSSPRQSIYSNYSAEGTHRTSSRAAPNSPGLATHQRRASDEARGHSISANTTADRKYGSQTDLRDKRSSQVAHSYRGSGLHHSHQPPALVHSNTSPARPGSTSQHRPTSNRRQTLYS